MNRTLCALLILLSLGSSAQAAGEGTIETSAPLISDSTIPVTKVTLYTAGLAYIVHETEVTGDTVLPFEVDQGDVNDILKSLVVEDLDGGTVDSVNFDTENPLSVVLSDMRVNPSGSPRLADFLQRTQGERVSVTLPNRVVSGRVFSVEERQEGDLRKIYLNLMGQDGLVSIDVTDMTNIRFDDTQLQADLLHALELIARARVKTTRTLRIYLRGQGTRRIRLTYLRAVPLWKTSYRITVDRDGSARLEGWALVQNTGNAPWSDVQLSFVSGRPNAFTMDLSTPKYVTRQRVDIAAATPLGPTEYEGGYAAEQPSMARSAPSMAPSAAPMASAQEMDDYAGLGTSNLKQESYTPPAVTARATGERQGNYYRYDVTEPVTVEARSSAMIPILVQADVGHTLAVYDPNYNLVFKGIRLTNEGDAHWSAGPVTVAEGRQYAGDALIPEMIPEAMRLITYAVHGTVEVIKTSDSQPQRIIALKVSGGLLYRTDKVERSTTYRIEGDENELILIHPKSSGWTLVDHPPIDEETPTEYRFTLDAWDDPVVVSEEHIVSNQYSLASFRQSDIAYYLTWGGISRDMKQAFERMATMLSDIDTIRSEVNSLTAQLSRLERDQTRVRENMKVLDAESDLYQRYETQLSEQEDQIQSLNVSIGQKQGDLADAQQKLRDFIAGLEID